MKKIQYYKMINPKGHNGLKYKMGKNLDPNPVDLSEIGSCEPGAIYFTTKKNLPGFGSYGNKIAWVTPIGRIVKDNEKSKAHGIIITKMLPVEKAIQEIFNSSKEETLNAFLAFHVDAPESFLQTIDKDAMWKYIVHIYNLNQIESFLRRHNGDKRLFKAVLKSYKSRRSEHACKEYFVALWLIKNGANIGEFGDHALWELYQYEPSFKTYLRKYMGEKGYKILRKLMD